MWIIILLVLAAAAYVIAKTVLRKADPAAGSTTESLEPPGGRDQSPANAASTAQVAPKAAAAQAAPAETPSHSTPEDSGSLDAKAAAYGVKSGDPATDVREMIKILNLRESDASRLGIEKGEFNALAGGSTTDVSSETLTSVRRQLVHWLS